MPLGDSDHPQRREDPEDRPRELSARVAAGDGIGSVSTAVHAYPTFTEAAARAADEHQRRRYSTPRALTRPVLALLRRLDRPDRRTSRMSELGANSEER